MLRIVVLNPKGGSGKSTIATGIAAMYAARGYRPVLMDFDPQGSASRWLEKRSPHQPPIHGIAAYARALGVTRSFQLRVPHGTDRVIVDTPAALQPPRLQRARARGGRGAGAGDALRRRHPRLLALASVTC